MSQHSNPPDLDDSSDDDALAQLFRQQVDAVRPDTHELLTAATGRGVRLRRRRRLLATSAGVLGAGGVAAAVVAVASLTSGSATTDQTPDFATAPTSSPSATPPYGRHATVHPKQSQPPAAETAPVEIGLAGWTCGEALDEKEICHNGSDEVEIVWRPASDHGGWTSDPDKTAAYVSKVHGNLFATVDPTYPTPTATAVDVGQSLRWTN